MACLAGGLLVLGAQPPVLGQADDPPAANDDKVATHAGERA
jgi:hypothetical protein